MDSIDRRSSYKKPVSRVLPGDGKDIFRRKGGRDRFFALWRLTGIV